MTWTKIADLGSTVPGPQGPQGLPGVNAVDNDAAVATYVSSDSATRAALEGRTGVVDTDYATLELALAATSAGGVLEIHGTYSRSTAFVIDKTCTVRFQGGSITTTVASIAAISVTADNVTIIAPVITGTGDSAGDVGAAISAIGTVSAPILGLQISDAKIQELSQWGIYLEHVHAFSVKDSQLQNIAYGAIAMLSCVGGEVTGNTITNVSMPSPFVGAYGIMMTRNSTQTISVAPRTSNILVSGNIVDGVPTWEGIDTHGGQNLTITGNKVFNCNTGIALVPCPNSSGVDTWAPVNCIVTNNIVDSKTSDGSRAMGISVTGAGTATDVAVEYASVTVANNTVIDHGNQASTSSGGISIVYARGSVIANNTIIRPAMCGLLIINANYGLVVSGNTVEDVWTTDSALTAAVYVKSQYNFFSVSGTQINRGAKTATLVNSRGLNTAASTNNVITDGGGNQWANATLPSSGDGTVLKAAAYTATPVVRAAAIASPTADVTALKTAVDALRTAIKNYGITL